MVRGIHLLSSIEKGWGGSGDWIRMLWIYVNKGFRWKAMEKIIYWCSVGGLCGGICMFYENFQIVTRIDRWGVYIQMRR